MHASLRESPAQVFFQICGVLHALCMLWALRRLLSALKSAKVPE